MHISHVIVINSSFAEVIHNACGILKKKKISTLRFVFESFYYEFILQNLHPPCISPPFLEDPFHDHTVTERIDGA